MVYEYLYTGQICNIGVSRSYILKQFTKHREHGEFCRFDYTIIDIDRYDGVSLLNEHGDLYFYCIILVYKLSPLNQKNFNDIYQKEKKI